MVLKEVVETAIHMQVDHVQFESDSQIVVQAIHASKDGSSKFSLIIKSINRVGLRVKPPKLGL